MVLFLFSDQLPYPICIFIAFILLFRIILISCISDLTATKKVLSSRLRTVPLEQKGNFFVFLYSEWHILVFCALVDLLSQSHVVLGSVTLGVVVEYAHAARSSLIELLTLAYGRVIEVLRGLCQ